MAIVHYHVVSALGQLPAITFPFKLSPDKAPAQNLYSLIRQSREKNVSTHWFRLSRRMWNPDQHKAVNGRIITDFNSDF